MSAAEKRDALEDIQELVYRLIHQLVQEARSDMHHAGLKILYQPPASNSRFNPTLGRNEYVGELATSELVYPHGDSLDFSQIALACLNSHLVLLAARFMKVLALAHSALRGDRHITKR